LSNQIHLSNPVPDLHPTAAPPAPYLSTTQQRWYPKFGLLGRCTQARLSHEQFCFDAVGLEDELIAITFSVSAYQIK